MLNKLLIGFVSIVFFSSCTSFSVLAPRFTPTVSVSTTTPSPTVAVEDLLAQQVASDLRAFPRPACEIGKRNEPEWTNYTQGLAAALPKLFADSRAQSLALPALTNIFSQASDLTLDTIEGNGDAVLVTIVKSNCPQRIGGGASPDSPRDTVYVINRRGGVWQIAQVANVVRAVWSEDHWNALVTQTQWGNAQDFEVWLVKASNGEWGKETKLKFSQLYGDPLPRLSADGLTVTLYAYAASCNIAKNPNVSPLPAIESDYKWQNGEYRCVASRVMPTPTPTRRP